MTLHHGFTLFIAGASLAFAGAVSAETNGVAPSPAAKKVADETAVPVVARMKEPKVAKPAAEPAKRSIASSTTREGAPDPYAVPLFKDARQLR